MAVSARGVAVDILIRIERKKSYGNLELKKGLGNFALSPREKKLATELVYGVLRYRLTLDWVLNHFLKKDIRYLPPPLRAIMRTGGYQILYLDRIPHSAACNESVKMTKNRGFSGFAPLVNAVLRKLARDRDRLPWPHADHDGERYISLVYSHPSWMVQRWLARLPFREVEALCQANNTPPPLSIRVNTLKTGVRELQEKLMEEGFETRRGKVPEILYMAEGRGDFAAAPGYREGLFAVQGEISALAARFLEPRPGQLVVDMCSAPGGKATHLAQLMEDRGVVLAGDLHPHRADLVKMSGARLSLKSISARVWDARAMPPELTGKAHRVLLDAPCSGLGVMGRKPDLKWQRKPEDIKSLAALQGEMLLQGAKLLNDEGLLLYSVCTNEPEETRDVLEAFLAENPGFITLPLDDRLPEGLEGCREEAGLQIYPHFNNIDGFYFALLSRKP